MTRHSVRFGLYLVIGYLYSGSIVSAQTPSKEYIRVNGRVVAIESTAINTACGAAQTTLPFRGTGTVTGTGVLTDGTIDPNWKLVSNPGNYPESSAVDLIAFTFAAYGNPIPNAKPINHSGNAAFHPVGPYVFRQKLDLSCHNPATLAISGTVQADDNLQIYVNGKLQSSPPAAWNIRVPFTIGGGAFVQGWNYVDFVVTNIGDPGNNPYMLLECTPKLQQLELGQFSTRREHEPEERSADIQQGIPAVGRRTDDRR